MRSILVIEAFLIAEKHWVSVETYIVIFIYQLAKPNVQLNVINISNNVNREKSLLQVDLTQIPHEEVGNKLDSESYCVPPVIYSEKNVIAGLCSVARQFIKCCDAVNTRKLLGFREACLMACSETSTWTRFCEIEMVETVKSLLVEENMERLMIPSHLARFEYHLQLPVKIHNAYKFARLQNGDKAIKSGTPIDELNLEHAYAEGPHMTLADAILFPCYRIIFRRFPWESRLPTTGEWFRRMSAHNFPEIAFNITCVDAKESVLPDFAKRSLYQAETKLNHGKRNFTKQSDVDKALETVWENVNRYINNDFLPYGHDVSFDWETIPLQAKPQGGTFPKTREIRKGQQLQCLIKAVIRLASRDCMKIVDFCSGSGYLGILLAFCLPKCEIILVENKERSLERAKERIEALKLQNVIIVQSNLDYFTGQFDIGVSLHACGVATDLVIKKCVDMGAHFVCCPCCYGSIQHCHQLEYPRSETFRKLQLGENYFTLAHAADQTHDDDNKKTPQGRKCMDIIDADRRLYAESHGYSVKLGKLQPVECTTKNNLLVGTKL